MTFYGYKPKKTTFAGGQGTTIGTPYEPVAYGGGVDSGGPPASGRELPSGLFGQGSRSGDRGLPERVPPTSSNPMEFVGTAVRAPGHVLERPLGIINVLTGGGGENKGAVDHILDAVGHVGVGPVSVGGLWGALDGALTQVGNFVPALMNSTDARLAAATASLPDSFVMDPKWLLQHGFDPTKQSAGGSIFGIGSHQKSVGELRAELKKRGFLQRDASLGADAPGNEMTWEEVAHKVNDDPLGAYHFGEHAVNDNMIVDMAARFTLDPVNLAFGLGAVSKAAKGASLIGRSISTAGHLAEAGEAINPALRFASWAQDGAFSLARAGNTALKPMRWGAGYLNDMAAAGVRAVKFKGPEQAALRFAQGSVGDATLKGLGWVGKTYFLPGEGSLIRRYARGAFRMEGTLLGAEAISYPLTQSLGSVPIVSGMLNGVHDMSKSFLEDKPLSNDGVFTLVSAFTFPGFTLAREQGRSAMDLVREKAGSPDLGMWARKWGQAEGSVLKDPTGRLRGSAKEKYIISQFGGEEGWLQAINHMDLRFAFKRLIENNPWVKEHYKSFDEAMARGSAIHERVTELAQSMRDSGQIKAIDRINTFEDWAQNRERTLRTSQGEVMQNVPESVRFDNISFEDMGAQWREYANLQAELGSRFAPVAEAITGRAGRLTQEDVDVLIATIKAGSVKGRTPTSLMTSVLVKHPGMFEDPALTPGEIEFWKTFMTRGRAAQGDLPVGGQLSRLKGAENPTYATDQLVARLEAVRSYAPPAKELFGEAAVAEAKVSDPAVEAGPLAAAGHRNIYSAEKLREVREKSQGNVVAATKEYVAAEAKFTSNFTKNGGPRKGSELDLDLERRYPVVESAEYDRIRQMGENLLDEGTHNRAEPTHFLENRDAVKAELFARTQEPWGGATYNPRSGEFVMPGDSLSTGEPYLYHGTMQSAMRGIEKHGMRQGSNWIADADRAGSYAIGEGAPIYRAAGSAIGGIEKAPGWMEGGRVGPSHMEVSVDGGKTWSRVAPKADGPYASSVGQEVTLSLADAADPVKFGEAVDRLVEINKDLLDHDNFYIGAFHDQALARVDLDVSMLNATREEAAAVQTALGNQHGGAYDFTSGDGVFGVNPDWSKYLADKMVESFPRTSREQADALAHVADVAARAWAERVGRSPNEFYSRFVGGIEKGMIPSEEALFQMDSLTLGRLGRHGIGLDDLNAAGSTARQMIEEPAPAILVDAGMAEAAPIEWQKFPGAPKEIGIPGGMAGLDDPQSVFSLWDLWRIKAQAINPNTLPPAIAQKLYTKLFRSQVRSLETDSLDAYNRMLFALQSPNQNLLANESLYSTLRSPDVTDVKKFASIYDDVAARIDPADKNFTSELGFEVQRRYGLLDSAPGEGVKTISSNIQFGNSVLLARRYLENPDFFLKKTDETMLEYVERLSAVTPGAAFKVANFGVMVGDPVRSTQGTLDSHMAQLLGVGDKAPPSKSITYRLAGTPIAKQLEAVDRAPSARLEPYWESDGLGVTRELKIGDKTYPSTFPKEGPTNGFVTKNYDLGQDIKDVLGVMFYGPDGKPAGFFSGLTKGKDAGAFKIVVDPALRRQGIGSKLLDEVERSGFDIRSNIAKNHFSSEGRALVRSWVEKSSAGRINPAVPEHLRNLPEGWEPQSVTVFGGKYAEAHRTMEQMYSEAGISAFGHGGYQWFRWDMKRGGMEPHTLIYPGAYRLPKMDPAERAAAFRAQQGAGYRSTSPLAFEGFSPRRGFLYQEGSSAAREAELLAQLKKTIVQSGPKKGSIKPGMEAESQRLNLAIEAERRGVRGETEFVNDVKGIMRGFDSADFSTAAHEWTHVYRRVVADSAPEDLALLESHFGVKDGAWARDHEEAFSAQFEAYLRSGEVANPELASVFEKFKVWLGELYAGIRGKKVKVNPEVRKVLDNLFSETAKKEMWAPLRQAHQEHLNLLREKVKSARREVRAIDRELEANRTIKIDPRFLDKDGNPRVDPASVEELQSMTRFVQQNYPSYDIEPAPRLMLQFKPDDSHLAGLITERGTLAHMVLEYGPLSKMFRIVDALTSPVNSQRMSRDARQMVFNKLLPLGATPKEVKAFFTQLSSTGKDLTTTQLHQPLFRGITALPPNAISAALRQATNGNEAFTANFVKKYGGMERAHVMLDESFNAAIRRVDTKRLLGQRVGKIEGAFRAGYYAWQTAPVLKGMSDSSRFLSKVAYPFFRFQMDIRWQTLNMVEADILAFFRDGFQATRFARRNDLLAPRGPRGKMIDLSDNAAALHMTRAGVPIPGLNHRTSAEIGSSPNLPSALADETGIQITNRHLYQVLKREFNVERPETIMKVIDDLPATDPTIGLLIKKFGTDRASWADQVAETIYSFDSKGVRHTVEQAAKQVQKFEKWTPTESAMMVPLVDKIIERNQRLMDDLLHVHIGNVNRSRLERVANSYWFYWPISYQIKAAKWMVKVMGERALGQNSNLGGAWSIDRLATEFKQQANQSEDFQQQLEQASPIWFMASMLLPIVPWDPGVSLNRYMRYVGGNGLGLWKAYSGLNTAQDWAMKFFEMGPIYTIKLGQQIVDSVTGDQTYSP